MSEPRPEMTGAQPAAWMHVATLRGLARRRGVDEISAHALAEAAKVIEEYDAEARRLRRGWLRVIQQENSCPATGGGCLAKRCGCLAEMEMLANEQV